MGHRSDYDAHKALAETSRAPRRAPPEPRSPRTLPVALVLRTLTVLALGLVVVKCF